MLNLLLDNCRPLKSEGRCPGNKSEIEMPLDVGSGEGKTKPVSKSAELFQDVQPDLVNAPMKSNPKVLYRLSQKLQLSSEKGEMREMISAY